MQKTKNRKSVLLRLVFFAFILYAVIYLVDMQVTLANRKNEIETLHAKYDEQYLANKELKRQLDAGTDEEELERIARDRLDYVAPDERVYIDISGS